MSIIRRRGTRSTTRSRTDPRLDDAGEVVSRSEGLTSARLPIRSGAVPRLWGDLSADPATGAVRDTVWVIDDSGLVHTMRDDEVAFSIEFFDWRTASDVTAPPADQGESELEHLWGTWPRIRPASDRPLIVPGEPTL